MSVDHNLQAGIVAAGVLQGVGQDGQLVEASLLVQQPGQPEDQARLKMQPFGPDRHRVEDSLEHVAEQVALVRLLLLESQLRNIDVRSILIFLVLLAELRDLKVCSPDRIADFHKLRRLFHVNCVDGEGVVDPG